MSPEFLMGDISQPEVGEVKEALRQPVKPKMNGHGHWSAIEIQEWRKRIGEAFDQMAHLGDAARFEKEHGVEQHPKPNGFQRLSNLGEDLEKNVRVETEEEVLGEEPLGYGPEIDRQEKKSEKVNTSGH